MAPLKTRQSITLPINPSPIMSIGLGGIVHAAHYPAYKRAGFNVVGGYDIDSDRATMMKSSSQFQ